jgi:probable rRNA maturation factor
MAVKVTVQRVFRGRTPSVAKLARWAKQAIAPYRADATLTIRIVGKAESTNLNQTWRHKVGPTNVLSFPTAGLEAVRPDLLGDVVICAPLIADEAKQQGKALDAHWAHLVVHGALHLLGFDHAKPAAAKAMESIERRTLAELGYPDPYGIIQ